MRFKVVFQTTPQTPSSRFNLQHKLVPCPPCGRFPTANLFSVCSIDTKLAGCGAYTAFGTVGILPSQPIDSCRKLRQKSLTLPIRRRLLINEPNPLGALLSVVLRHNAAINCDAEPFIVIDKFYAGGA